MLQSERIAHIMRRMKGKVAIVTGGASGIGRATALAFAREGAAVVIGDLESTAGEQAVAKIKEKAEPRLSYKWMSLSPERFRRL